MSIYLLFALSLGEQRTQPEGHGLVGFLCGPRRPSARGHDHGQETCEELHRAEYPNGKLDKKIYEKELARLQEELVKLQYWIKDRDLKARAIFEVETWPGREG